MQNLPSPGRRRIHIFVQIQSLILSGKNVLQELLSRELKTMRHVSFIKNLDNLNAIAIPIDSLQTFSPLKFRAI